MPAARPDNPPADPPGAAPPSFDLTNKTLGEFKIIRRLGKGGMAEVYLAEQGSLNRQVAIKVLRPEFLSDANYVKRFQHEATAAGGLNHPNIVQVYTIGEQGGLHYIAQEYVRGNNLRDFMRKKGRLELPIALHLLRQVAAALQVAGSAGIVHRDIKPENILLTKKGEAKVADFGLAQLSQGSDRVALTQVGITMGTPLYMSPEQAAGKQVDHRSDLYSFGAMAYHMLAGQPPFQGDTAVAVAVQHLNEKPRPLKEYRPDLPQPVCDLVHKLIAKRKDERYPDAQTLLGELKALQKQFCGRDGGADEAAFNAVANTGAIRIRQPLLDRSMRYQLLMFSLVGALIMGTAAGAGWQTRVGNAFETPPPPEPGVPHYDTIAAQYFYAMCHGNDEAAWTAVVEYPSEPGRKELERKLAQLRLAIVYLQQNRLDLAEQIFRSFHDGTGDPWQETHALAGEVILKSLRSDFAGAERDFQTLVSRGEKIDAKLKPILDEAHARAEEKSKKT